MRTLSLAFTFLLAFNSQAEEQPPQHQQRIDFIQQQFEQTRNHSQTWQWGWFGFLGSASVVQTIVANTADDDKLQYDMSVGAVTSFLGAADMLLNPMQSHNYSDQLQQMNSNSVLEKTDKLQQAEAWLVKAAAREAYEQSWTNHLLAGLVNGLAGLAVAYDDKRPIDGWLTFATGVAVSEFKIYTAPQTMMAAQQAYQNGNYSTKTAKTNQQRLFVAAAGPNLMINWKF
ncbi:hypothetical protein OLEAN_C09820 [Oleispira antarctica RB-8]|uniref:Uncharacterized protein n=1 Tax=Oleispira antarctica RB-8 TaxID=698738 RepID=R4YPI7_OLEAN|nr:hypothetical protein OLEAN_C09820 [Oleispira antarctica RB-8]|tara:strand:+ start:6653 stop:7339 length:687 start_codon:yes stop_codon:yes gene_type:complete